LEQVLHCEALLFKNDGSTREMEGLPSYVEAAKGKFDELGQVSEDGLEFQVPFAEGQKTGWFFDQTSNRRNLVKYIRKDARMLDVFSYVGAWGVRAAHSGAREVLCVDSSAAALELAASNAQRNRVDEGNGGKLTTLRGDAFDVLEGLAKQRARFDVVVIDPPAFAKRKKDLPKALAAYKRLNQLAMRVIADDGMLVSCSCSYHVSPEDLQDAIAKAAKAADKHLQILEVGGQAPDHPVHPAIPETRYLKAYFCRVNESLK
jgi:23S rRNA (cytosine1962-C5)-methyltransferase